MQMHRSFASLRMTDRSWEQRALARLSRKWPEMAGEAPASPLASGGKSHDQRSAERSLRRDAAQSPPHYLDDAGNGLGDCDGGHPAGLRLGIRAGHYTDFQ